MDFFKIHTVIKNMSETKYDYAHLKDSLIIIHIVKDSFFKATSRAKQASPVILRNNDDQQ